MNLDYQIDSGVVAEVLGIQNFNNRESAVLELIKNSYDAAATFISIKISRNELLIIDNGNGMKYDELYVDWMKIGNSKKKNLYKLTNNEQKDRVLSGSKGIGRFAIARLGKEAEIYTKNRTENRIWKWQTNWEKTSFSEVEKISYIEDNGTAIRITATRESWNRKDVETLCKYLSTVITKTDLMIEIEYEGESFSVENVFDNLKLGINYLSQINIDYQSETKVLKYSIKQDEFQDIAEKYTNIDIRRASGIIDVLSNLDKDFKDKYIHEIDIVQEAALKIGDFSATLFFGMDRISNTDKHDFLYKHDDLFRDNTKGIVLYRNTFSISSFDGKKDWLGLSIRSRKSPAAATHIDGKWRVRDNQLGGYITLDREKNSRIEELSNRQGITENIYSDLLITIINMGIAQFENYRQQIIRDINKKNKVEEKVTPLIESITKKPSEILNMRKEQLLSLVEEIKNYKSESARAKKGTEQRITDFKYDIRMLNSLATAGLKGLSRAHDLNNKRNKLNSNVEFVRRELVNLNLWSVIEKNSINKPLIRNIPELLSENENFSKGVSGFITALISGIEKTNFKMKDINLYDYFQKYYRNSALENGKVTFDFICSEELTVFSSKDILNTIFDNLLLNSIQQNSNSSIKINVAVTQDEKGLVFRYSDNGRGLHSKYMYDTFKIMDVHESTREDGHGLGMWIINKTIVSMNGEVIEIPFKEKLGFEITFRLGELGK